MAPAATIGGRSAADPQLTHYYVLYAVCCMLLGSALIGSAVLWNVTSLIALQNSLINSTVHVSKFSLVARLHRQSA
jgi:hypothetical protein